MPTPQILSNSAVMAAIASHNEYMSSFEDTSDYELSLWRSLNFLRERLEAAELDPETVTAILESDAVAH